MLPSWKANIAKSLPNFGYSGDSGTTSDAASGHATSSGARTTTGADNSRTGNQEQSMQFDDGMPTLAQNNDATLMRNDKTVLITVEAGDIEEVLVVCEGATVRELVDQYLAETHQTAPIDKIKVYKIDDKGTRYRVHSIDQETVDADYGYKLIDTQTWPTVTILVLGESGVGKSTWVNGIANYATYDTLDVALENEIVCLIPSVFYVTKGRPPVEREVRIGEASDDERHDVGRACTQAPKIYLIYDERNERYIRIIDTPGVGDADGEQKDAEHFKSIVDCVGKVEQIHGICILLKPNDAKLNVVFRYCINELLTHLSKTAAKNIAFCFTNARSSSYGPGNTWKPLCKMLDQIQEEGTTIQRDNYFCFDNEAFRFLAASKANVDLDEEKELFAASWNRSVKETNELINHFLGLDPHNVAETVSVNKARENILTITRPLAEVSKFVQDNMEAITLKTEEIGHLDSKKSSLKDKLFIPQVAYENKNLDYPMTVCASEECTKSISVPGSKATQIVYETVCHDHCYLDDVLPDTFPQPEIQHCAAIGADLHCKKCKHSWDIHIHITYLQEKKTIKVKDPNVELLLERTGQEKEAVRQLRKHLEERKEKYEFEQATIYKICAKFGRFLKKSSILPYNDAVESYLNLLIREEKRKLCPDVDMIENLENSVRSYLEQKSILDASMAPGVTLDGEAREITADDVAELEKQLTDLPLCGKMLADAFAAARSGNSYAYQHFEVHVEPERNKGVSIKKMLKNAGNSALDSFSNAMVICGEVAAGYQEFQYHIHGSM